MSDRCRVSSQIPVLVRETQTVSLCCFFSLGYLKISFPASLLLWLKVKQKSITAESWSALLRVWVCCGRRNRCVRFSTPPLMHINRSSESCEEPLSRPRGAGPISPSCGGQDGKASSMPNLATETFCSHLWGRPHGLLFDLAAAGRFYWRRAASSICTAGWRAAAMKQSNLWD